jgi:5'-phosphate synthase pdxT subunit
MATDGLIIPGGESTTIGMLMDEYGLLQAVRERASDGRYPLWGTCAGLILLARQVQGKSPARLGLMDIIAARNAWGRQVASFEVPIVVEGIGSQPFPAVFIRAPRLVGVGPGVKVLAYAEGEPVMAEQGPYLVTAFHPELSQDDRIHRYFIAKVESLAALQSG